MGFASVEEIETRAKEQECQLWETILHDDMTERQVDRLESIGKMSSMYLAMKDANESYDKDLKSQSGLSGGDGEKMMEEVRKMQNLTGEFVGTVMANALKMDHIPIPIMISRQMLLHQRSALCCRHECT